MVRGRLFEPSLAICAAWRFDGYPRSAASAIATISSGQKAGLSATTRP
jgi:hypothetical protein